VYRVFSCVVAAVAAAVAGLHGEPVLGVFHADERDWCSVAVLRSLHSLTRLAIDVTGYSPLEDPPECNETFWRSMAELTSLRDLYIHDLGMKDFGGIVELVSCRQLTHLWTDNYQDCSLDFEMEVRTGARGSLLRWLLRPFYCGGARVCLL
jgi:hypothetical protein